MRLVEDVRHGDHGAFEVLVRRYEGRLMSVLLRFVQDRELARDLSQETFLRVYERLDQFDPSRRFGPWLFRIGVNLTLDYLRKRKRRIWPSLFSDSRVEKGPDPAVVDPRQRLDLEQEVRKVLEGIPEKYRTVLILRDLENFSSSENCRDPASKRGHDSLAAGGSSNEVSGNMDAAAVVRSGCADWSGRRRNRRQNP